jgi:lipopolysaccharide export system protein LptA
MRASNTLWVAAAILVSALVVPALAQDSSSRLSGLKLSGDQPIQIESDKLEVRETDSVAIFTGNVSVTQGPTVMKSGRMTVYYAKDGAGSAATGSANIDKLEVDDKVYVKSNNQVATGDKGVFDMKTEVLVLSGNEVVLSEGDNVLVGCKLTVQMRTGEAQVDGCKKSGSTSGRVIMSITPGSAKSN